MPNHSKGRASADIDYSTKHKRNRDAKALDRNNHPIANPIKTFLVFGQASALPQQGKEAADPNRSSEAARSERKRQRTERRLSQPFSAFGQKCSTDLAVHSSRADGGGGSGGFEGRWRREGGGGVANCTGVCVDMQASPPRS